jgi:hypothetical protein
MGRKTIDDEMMIDYSNNISYTNSKIEWTQWTHWTYPSYCSKFAKSSTNLLIFEQFLSGGGMSSVCRKVTGHPPSFECSKTLYNNSVFSSLRIISCVKSVLKKAKDKKIKKFYWSEGMSTMSSVSSILKNRFSKL